MDDDDGLRFTLAPLKRALDLPKADAVRIDDVAPALSRRRRCASVPEPDEEGSPPRPKAWPGSRFG
jgi:hypothetical protein